MIYSTLDVEVGVSAETQAEVTRMVLWMRKRVWQPAFLMLVAATLQAKLGAGIIFQSASAPTSKYPGVVVANSSFAQQAPGVRFQITETAHIDSITVWIYHNDFTVAGLFGEIFALPDSTSYPSSDPYSNSGLVRAYFGAPQPGSQPSDMVAPLSYTLTPGNYALVIASVSDSEWAIPTSGVDGPGVTPGDFIIYLRGSSFPGPNYPRWQQGQDGMRFVINGSAVPEPGSLILAGSALGCLFLIKRSRRESRDNVGRRPTFVKL